MVGPLPHSPPSGLYLKSSLNNTTRHLTSPQFLHNFRQPSAVVSSPPHSRIIPPTKHHNGSYPSRCRRSSIVQHNVPFFATCAINHLHLSSHILRLHRFSVTSIANYSFQQSSPRAGSPVNTPSTGASTARPTSPKAPGGPATAIRRKAASDFKEKAANARPSSTRAAGAGGSSSTMLSMLSPFGCVFGRVP
jgi:hypothetical protein